MGDGVLHGFLHLCIGVLEALGLEDRVPAKFGDAAGWNHFAMGPADEQQGLRAGIRGVCKYTLGIG